MDGRSRDYEDVSHNNKMLLDLIQTEKEERELELRLGPPGDEQDWSHHYESNNKRERDDSSSNCFGKFSSHKIHHHQHNQDKAKDSSSFLELQSSTQNMHSAEKKEFSPSSGTNAVVPNSSQKRTTAPGPVVGWPPIRSFRKNNNNIASESSSKHPPYGSHQHKLHQSANNNKEHVHNNNNVVINKGFFVKINMDGVPIGRKVDINACGSYEKLASAVYELFRTLLAARRDSSDGGIQNKKKDEEEKVITGLLEHGRGEYTLAFQDCEGHNMLVGDVPWPMFVSTVKRLRVLKSSNLSVFSIGSKHKAHTSLDKAMI